MFGSSVLMTYDAANCHKFDCRRIDFAKTYVNITERAREFGEAVYNCDDGVAGIEGWPTADWAWTS
jgi:hypothetical protein